MSKCHRCDATCKYFPAEASKILDEYFDAYGVKHRESISRAGMTLTGL